MEDETDWSGFESQLGAMDGVEAGFTSSVRDDESVLSVGRDVEQHHGRQSTASDSFCDTSPCSLRHPEVCNCVFE